MDERLKGIVDNFDSMKIGMDEIFKFHCTMCGNCCINREDILLSPQDIYNISKELGVAADNPQEELKDIDASQIQYIFNNPGCGNDSEDHTVREWLESFGISASDKFFIKWQQTVLKMGNIFRTIEKGMSSNIMEQVWTAAFVGLYLSYETEREFVCGACGGYYGGSVFYGELTYPSLGDIIRLLIVIKLIKEELWSIHYIIY